MNPPFYFFCTRKVLFLPPKKSFSSCGGRHEQFSYFSIYFQFTLSSRHCCVPQLRVCHHQYLGDERELGVLASIHTTNLLPHSLPQIPLAPSVPISPPKPSYLTDILDLYWGYLGHILTLHIESVTFYEHFQQTLTTSSPQLQNTSKTVLWSNKYSRLHPLPPPLYNYSSSPTPPLHWSDYNNRVLVLMVSYFHPFIVILIYLPALKHLNIQKIFFYE